MRGSPSPLLRTGPKEMDACTVGNQDNRLRERKEEGKKKMEKRTAVIFLKKWGKVRKGRRKHWYASYSTCETAVFNRSFAVSPRSNDEKKSIL